MALHLRPSPAMGRRGTAAVPPAAPGSIADLTATNYAEGGVQLAFTDATGATWHQYRIDGGSWQALSGDKIVSGLGYATGYDFEVRGANGGGYGAASNLVTLTTWVNGYAAPAANYAYLLAGEDAIYIDVERRRVDAGGNHRFYQPKGGGRDPIHQEYLRRYTGGALDFDAVYSASGDSDPTGTTGTDWTSQIDAALKAVANNQYVKFGPGYYRYTGYHFVYSRTNSAVIGEGPESTVFVNTSTYDQSSDANAKATGSAFLFLPPSTGCAARDFTISSVNNPTRRDNYSYARGIDIETGTGCLIENVVVKGVANAGFFLNSCTDSMARFCTAYESKADSFHTAWLSTRSGYQFNRAYNCGDDSFASIGGSTGNVDTWAHDNLSESGYWASGVSFEGTNGGKAYRNRITGTGAAGIRVATPSSFAGPAVNNIDIAFNLVEDCVTRSGIGHGALFLSSDYADITNVTFRGNYVSDPLNAYGLRGEASTGRTATATATSNIFVNSTGNMTSEPNAIVNSSPTRLTLTVSGNTYNGAATS